MHFNLNVKPKIQILNWPYATHVERGSTDKIAFPFFQACANIFLKYLQLCQASSLFYITTPSVNYLACKVNIFFRRFTFGIWKKFPTQNELKSGIQIMWFCKMSHYIVCTIFERFYPNPWLMIILLTRSTNQFGKYESEFSHLFLTK